ncbi:LysR family transcriptional regulator [Asticcacaulis sp. EMRT-3]|uniref:LysR family transcriptional regulator n=1 Tax=Asticcacaulis sp. EMRT-3 TaxID=3040349 RepID=UPI0024AF7995|nr:LysR family transcriptional regulator [Asticcacaulis sp. EMRT-3]MDI7776478.1 LysR family transcriptional regulator [Asticcacaulis sp. EMRT-3]
MEWSDLKIFLAVARAGTLGGAARQIGQTQPTLGRRLRALEAALGQSLFQRTPAGFVLTDEGLAVLGHAERMEEEALSIARQTGAQPDSLSGFLRLSASEWFGTYVLAPVLAEFSLMHPAVTVELVTDARLYSLSRREADLVFRIGAFDEPDVRQRRLLTQTYAVYKQMGKDHSAMGLILMDTALDHLPDVKWLRALRPDAPVVFRSNNREAQARLCRMGAGLAVLPRRLAEQLEDLEVVDLGDVPPARDLFFGYHRDLGKLARLRALIQLVVARLGDN